MRAPAPVRIARAVHILICIFPCCDTSLSTYPLLPSPFPCATGSGIFPVLVSAIFAATGPITHSMNALNAPRNAIIALNSGTTTETSTARQVTTTRCTIA